MLAILKFKKLTLIIPFLMLFTQLNAQLCTGNLGDPVFTQNFGTGLNPIGPALGVSALLTLTLTVRQTMANTP